MNNTLLNSIEQDFNYKETENGAIAHKRLFKAVYEMFGLGGAYRHRPEEDCVLLFKRAMEEDATLALKCLFYLRDIRGGQGERRFFRICFHWLAKNYPEIASRNLKNLPEYGRYDDLYCCVGTPIEDEMWSFIKNQLAIDLASLISSDKTSVSLLGKWLCSENASAESTKKYANLTRKALHMSHKQYRKTLSKLRTRINIVEKLMSENRWDEIEFDKLPSKAGLVYANAFAHKDVTAARYATFMSDKDSKVNAGALYPYDLVHKAVKSFDYHGAHSNLSETEREAFEKMWNNLPDYFDGSKKNILAVVDTSGSMCCERGVAPIDMAISLGMYCGERSKGDFKDYYISFASRPQLIKIEGSDFVDKVARIYATNLCDNTDLEAVFNLLKNQILSGKAKATDLPDTIVVISDMEIDAMSYWDQTSAETEMERLAKDWKEYGLTLPKLVYWNVDARHDTYLGGEEDRVSYMSGCSPVAFKGILSGKTGYDLCLEMITSSRYDAII